MNILLCICKKFLFPTKILISSLENHNKENLNIYILHKELTNTDIEDLNKAIDKSKTRIIDIKIDTSEFDYLPVSERFSIEVYFRLFAEKWLPKDLDRILYLDADTLVINSISNLYNSDFNGKALIGMPFEYQHLEQNTRDRLYLSKNSIIVNSGVLLLNLDIFRKIDYEKIIKNFVNKSNNGFINFDQDIINAVFVRVMKFEDYKKYNFSEVYLKYCNKVKPISLEWIKNNTSILHYFGATKPWNIKYVGLLKSFYQEEADKYWSKIKEI